MALDQSLDSIRARAQYIEVNATYFGKRSVKKRFYSVRPRICLNG